ncbi:MAG TPA: tetratricopeptide repeat protein [Methyloceanibacter sp.]|nr:tetratricopeptide repeat protein [Methyloceanibacter sp.]
MALISQDYWSKDDRKAIREQLNRIVRSGPFVQSRRRQRFLEYIVHETLAGRGERLKGYSIALEVFDRPETFDPVADPIVRIEAGRLREKLRSYYETDGIGDPIHIELPRGSYLPRIAFRNTVDGAVAAPPAIIRVREAGAGEGEARDALLTGLGRFWRYTREACAEAQHHFAEAVEIDQQYAAAHAWLARTYVWQSCMNWVPANSAIEPALDHARRAVEIDAWSPLGHSILGKVRLYLKDSESAVAEAERACTLDPDSAEARMFLAFILAAVGRGADALRSIETAMLLQPHPSSYYFETLGLSHCALGDYDRAIAAFLRGIEINPSYMPCHYELAVAYGVRGRVEEAGAEAAIVKADCPSVSADFILDPALVEIYRRGQQVAGLA